MVEPGSVGSIDPQAQRRRRRPIRAIEASILAFCAALKFLSRRRSSHLRRFSSTAMRLAPMQWTMHLSLNFNAGCRHCSPLDLAIATHCRLARPAAIASSHRVMWQDRGKRNARRGRLDCHADTLGQNPISLTGFVQAVVADCVPRRHGWPDCGRSSPTLSTTGGSENSGCCRKNVVSGSNRPKPPLASGASARLRLRSLCYQEARPPDHYYRRMACKTLDHRKSFGYD